MTNETTNVVRMKPVESSNVKEIGYEAGVGLLVRFKSGVLYQFPGFPADQFQEFAQAESFGSYFARQVKPFFEGEPFEKRSDEPKTLGEVAFQRYTEARGGRAVDGSTIPEWIDLDNDIRAAWEAAANAVLECYPELE